MKTISILKAIIAAGFSNLNYAKWQTIRFNKSEQSLRQFTFLPVPEHKKKAAKVMKQLGLFDTPVEGGNKVLAYLVDVDKSFFPDSVKLIGTVRSRTKPSHDSLILLTARTRSNNWYLYKLYSNFAEISFSKKWLSGVSLGRNLTSFQLN